MFHILPAIDISAKGGDTHFQRNNKRMEVFKYTHRHCKQKQRKRREEISAVSRQSVHSKGGLPVIEWERIAAVEQA